MDLVASVCPRVSVRCHGKEQQESLSVYGVCLCVCNQEMYTNTSPDAVDQLLIFHCFSSNILKSLESERFLLQN